MKDIMEATALVQNVKPVISVRVEARQNVAQVRMQRRDLAAVVNVVRERILGKAHLRVRLVKQVRFQPRERAAVPRVMQVNIPQIIRAV